MTFRCVALHSKADADQISDEPCLRRAALRFAFALLCSSKQRLRSPHQSIAVACRGFASPWQSNAALILRRSPPSCAVLGCAVAVRRRSQLGCSTPLRIGSLPVLHGAVRCFAPPSPLFSKLCRAGPRRPLPLKAFALIAMLCCSFAIRGLAVHFRRLPEQIKALPLQRPSPRRHRAARPSHANPLPPTSSRCRRISLKASPRCSVAPPRYAAQIHRRTMPLMALPSRIIATLR